MTSPIYPNETQEYRTSRAALLLEEQALVEKVKSVAELRRQLPLGGKLKEDYVFDWASGDRLGQTVKLSDLFGEKSTLLLYSFMYGPNWDNPCPSCTSLMDGFDRAAFSVGGDAAFVGIAKAPATAIDIWAKKRGWSQISLISGAASTYQTDYGCQGKDDDEQFPMMHVFKREGADIFHFWGSELKGNHIDTVWAYWNLMDFTPEGRPDLFTPPQNFRSQYLEDNYSE